MHSIRRDDYDQHADDRSAVSTRRASVYQCLHVDDFIGKREYKRHRSLESAGTRSVGCSIERSVGTGTASPATHVPQTHTAFDSSVHRLKGVCVVLADLPDPSSSYQSHAREQAAVIIRNCFSATWEQSTITRYNAVLEGAVVEAEAVLGVDLLPCDTDIKLMLLFTRFDGAPWGTVSASKCAVRAWHLERGLSDVFRSVWSERALFFWKGLKKRADHTRRRAKRAVYHKELLLFQRARVDAGTVAGTRDAAIAAVCFYGIRRSAEALALQVGDLSVRKMTQMGAE